MLFGGNPRYENMPLIGRGSPPPTVTGPPRQGRAEAFLGQVSVGDSAPAFPQWDEGFHLPHLGGLEGGRPGGELGTLFRGSVTRAGTLRTRRAARAPGCPASVLDRHCPGRERQVADSVVRKCVCRTGDSGRLQ